MNLSLSVLSHLLTNEELEGLWHQIMMLKFDLKALFREQCTLVCDRCTGVDLNHAVLHPFRGFTSGKKEKRKEMLG